MKLKAICVLMALLALEAGAAYETLIDFTKFTKGDSWSISPGDYASAYAAEQIVISEKGITVYSDAAKQKNPDSGWFTMNIGSKYGATTNWYERDFELVLSGSPQGRDGRDIAINLTDSSGETYQYYPSSFYIEDGNLHLKYRNSHQCPASGHWGGDGDGTITPPMRLSALNVHFSGIAGIPGEVTFNKIVSTEDGDLERNVEVIEPVSLDTTYPGAAPFTGPYRLDFVVNKPFSTGIWLYLYEESDHNVTFGTRISIYRARTDPADRVTFDGLDVNPGLDPTRHYHYYKLDISSSCYATNCIGYFRQTAAEAMRIEVDTKNELHICRDETERPELLVWNPSTTNLHWKTEFVVSDTFGREYRIPFDRMVKTNETVRIDLPWPLPMGVWYVNARVYGDDGSMTIKSTQFAHIPRHEVTPKIERFKKFRFGIHNHSIRYGTADNPNQVDKFVSAIVAAGAKFTRTDYSFMFSDICTDQSVYENSVSKWKWANADFMLDKFVNAGLGTEIIIYSAPTWAQDPDATWNQTTEGRNGSRSGCRPMKPGIFRNFCEQFGRRYSGKIDYYEVGNEWDIVPRVTLSPEEAHRMQKEAYEGLHAGDANACVCPNGWAGVGVSYNKDNEKDPNWNWMLPEAISDDPECFDNWLIHVHSAFEIYERLIDTYMLPVLKDKLKGKKTWVSGESAITSAYGNEYNQGVHVWYKTLFAWNRGAQDYIWYNLKATGWFDGGEPGFGLMTPDYHPRAGYAAFAAVTDIFEGLDADGTVYEVGSRKLFRYKGTNLKESISGVVLAGWDRKVDGEWEIELDTDATRAEMSDHMGNRTEVEIRSGRVVFTGAAAPRALILHGATYARVPRAMADDFNGTRWYVDVANPAKGEGSAENPFRTIQDAVNAAHDMDVIEIAAGEYCEGESEDATFGTSRVVLDRKVRIVGAGRGKTIIRGGERTRCMLIKDTAAGAMIEGVSLLGGGTAGYDETQYTMKANQSNIRCKVGGVERRLLRKGGNVAACGGGVYYLATNRFEVVYLVNCRVGHCRAGFAGGAVYGPLSLIRTLVDNSYSDTNFGGAIAHVSCGYSSVFASNGREYKNHRDSVHAAPEDMSAGHVEGVFVNCTMTGNISCGVPFHTDDAYMNYNLAKGFTFYNCVFYPFSEARYVSGGIECYNCCQSYYGSIKQQTSYKTDGYNAYGNIGGDGYPRLHEDNLPFKRNQFVSGYGDWHLREGSYLIGKGSNVWINAAVKFVPQEYLAVDYYGAQRIEGESVDMGAAEGGFAQGCEYVVKGDLEYSANDCKVDALFEGLRVSGLPGAGLALDFDTKGAPLYGVLTTNLLFNARKDYYSKQTNFRRYYPDFMGTEVRLRVEDAATSEKVMLTATAASSEKWVDPVCGSDANPGSKALPFRTLAKAVSMTPKYGVVYAKPGVYAEGVMVPDTDADWPKSTSNRVSITRDMRLVGVEGAKKTVIMGEAAKSGFINSGCGAGAVRCVGVGGGVFAQVQGFTLTGGHTDSDPIGKSYAYQKANGKTIKTGDASEAYNWTGAGMVGDSYSVGRVTAVLSDCIVSNNVAYRHSAVCAGKVVRCIITDNATVDALSETNGTKWIFGCIGFAGVEDSIVYGNERIAGTVVSCAESVGHVYHTVISEGGASLAFDRDMAVYNSMFVGCSRLPDRYAGDGNITNPPCAHTERGLFRIAEDSSAASAGRSENGDEWRYAYYSAGLDGVWPDVAAERIAAGPYHDLRRSGLKVAEPEVSGLSPSGFYPTEGRTRIELKAVDTLHRFTGYKIGDVSVPVGARDFEVVIDSYLSPFETVELAQTFVSDWYVDAENGDDENNGLSLATAKRTLMGALRGASKDEIVYVAPGEYSEGCTNHSETCWYNTRNHEIIAVTNVARAVVPDGVTLVSLEGAEKTIIKGYRTPGSPSHDYYGKNGLAFGFGPDSIRGVVLGRNTLLKGFTIKECSLYEEKGGSYCDNQIGAGVLCRDSSSVVEDCYFTLCDAGIGGAAYGGTFRRCRFVDNFAVSTGGSAAYGRYYNCYFDKTADKVLDHAYAIENCTIGPNNRYFGGSSGGLPSSIFTASVDPTNCLILAVALEKYTNSYLNAANCIFAYSGDPGQVRCSSDNQKIAQKTLLTYYITNQNFSPRANAPSIDAGLESAESAQSPYDAFGNIRVVDQIDIGAWEYGGGLVEPYEVVVEKGSRRIEDGASRFAADGRYMVSAGSNFVVKSDWIIEPGAKVVVSNGTVEGKVMVKSGEYDLTSYMSGISASPIGGVVVFEPVLDASNESVVLSLEPKLEDALLAIDFGVILPNPIPGLWYSLIGADNPRLADSSTDDERQSDGGPLRLHSSVSADARFFRTAVSAQRP